MKKIAIFLTVLIGIIFVSCNNQNKNTAEIFNTQAAKGKAKQYVYRIQNGDLAGANEISTKKLASEAKLEKNKLPIVAFREEKVTEVNNGAYIELNVIRSSESIAKCNMDKWVIKVEKDSNSDYKVAEVESNLLKDAIAKEDTLYLIDAGNAQREVLTKLNDIPGVLYPENEKVMLNKNSIPKKQFQTLGMNFNGDKISFSTTDGKNCFIGVALLDSIKAVSAKDESRAVNGDVSPNDLKEIFDKPIAQKIVYCDILMNSKVDRFIFAEEGNAVVVQYMQGADSLGVNIYTLPDGGLAPLNLESTFPLDKYMIKYVGSIKSNILIQVNKKVGVTGINQELLGQYLIDLKDNSLNKV